MPIFFRFLLTNALIVCIIPSHAQVFESFAKENQFNIEAWFVEPLDENSKFNFFSYNEFFLEYEQNKILSHLNLFQANCDMWKGIGPMVGWRITSDRHSPHIGIQYTRISDFTLLSSQFSFELSNSHTKELFTIVNHTFDISDNFDLFTQLQSIFTHMPNTWVFSLHKLRIGPTFGKVQTGIGIDISEFGPEFDPDILFGLFFRVNFAQSS